MIKKRIVLKTREDIEREGIELFSSIEENDATTIPLPILFEVSIKLYGLMKSFPQLLQNSKFDELVEFTFQRYRPILRVRR